MMFGMEFGSLCRVMGGVRVMAVGYMRMMASLLDIVVAMVLGSLTMVLRRLFVMMSSLMVVIDNFVFRHRFASSLELGLNPGRSDKG